MTNNVRFYKVSATKWTTTTPDANAFYLVGGTDLYLGSIKLSDGPELAAAIERIADNEGEITQIKKDLAALIGSDSGSISEMISSAIAEEREARVAEEARIEGLVTAEKSRAEGAEATLQGKIDTVSGAVETLDGKVDANKEEIDGKFATLSGTVEGHTTAIGENKAAVEAEAERAKGVEEGLQDAIDAVEATVDSLFDKTAEDGSVTNGVIRNTAADEVAKIVANAPENLDTLKEIADYIAGDGADAAGLVNRIATLEGEMDAAEDRLDVVEPKVDTLEDEMDAVEGRLDVVEPKVETLEGEMDAVQEAIAHAESGNAALLSKINALDGVVSGNKSAEEQARAALQEQITANANAITAINAASTGILDVAKKYTDDSIAGLGLGTASQKSVEYFEGDATAKANQALADAKTYVGEQLAPVNTNIDALDTALTWQTLAD